MKKTLLPFIAALFLLFACNTKKTDTLDTEKRIVFTDTAAAMKSDASTDVGTNNSNTALVAEKPLAKPKEEVKIITKIVKVYEKQPAPKPIKKETPAVVQSAETNQENTSTGNTDDDNSTTSPTEPEKKKNTGWSDAAKTATIGGVGGAVIGGIIGKGGKGAAIGGVIGAAGGYILGRKKDRKTGRVDTTKN